MNIKLISKKFAAILFLLVTQGCNSFDLKGWASSFGYNVDECEARDRTHHYAPYYDGINPDRVNIQARKYRCRIERICVGKSEEENEKCKKDAGDYWGFKEDNKIYQSIKRSDNIFDAICTLNRNPWNPNFKGCSPKWHSQENYSTNPYWNKETKSYILLKREEIEVKIQDFGSSKKIKK